MCGGGGECVVVKVWWCIVEMNFWWCMVHERSESQKIVLSKGHHRK